VIRFDPREWTPQRLHFAAYRLLGLFFLLRRRAPKTPDYDQAVLARRSGRNPFETYSIAIAVLLVYAAAAAALLNRMGMADRFMVPALPLIAALALLLIQSAVLAGGFVSGILGIDDPRLVSWVHGTLVTTAALLLLLRDHWTRWVGAAWLLLLAINLLAGLAVFLLKPILTRVSEDAWRNTQFVD
jgi:hypothetical protein